ncbi:MAG: hybrid sensor histidine kinase/response regulator [Gemmatimonadetes bacterium]|nr:MAG: hybrid sensor histidine kinase/response regulator [Gemmatimonadota bacterium]
MSPPSLRVLVVEDRAEDAELSVRELHRAELDCETRRVDTAEAFRRALTDFAPDIVLADYTVPGFGGMAALEIVRRAAPALPLIIVTGSLDEETAAECIKAGAADYVLKTNLLRLGPAVRAALALAKSRSDKQAAEAALRVSERRFRALVEESWDGVALLAADGTIVYGSPATSRLLGYDLAEFVGHNAMEFIHSDDRAAVLLRLEEVTARPRSRLHVAARVRHKNGTWRHLEGVWTNLLDDPSVAAIVNNYRDVTDRRLLEEQIVLSQKMEAIGRLAGGVAHDFNNILTAIGGYSDLLMSDLAEDDPRRRDVEEIHQATQRAASLTQQLLAFSRRQVLQPKVINFNALIPDLEKMLRRLIGEDILFATVLHPRLGNVRADPGKLEQVIVNLAVNARDAMPKGGRLTIETRNVELDESYAAEHPSVKPGRYVMLTVTDTGVGMDEDTKARIFEPFFTTKTRGKGTGLGLATVYGIVQQTGGHIWPYSEPGRGTTMRVYLPRVDDPADPIEHPGELGPEVLHGSETILLVEDEAPVRAVTRQLLERNGYTVLEAADGPAALALVDGGRGHLPVDLLLTDVIMPGMSGRELANQLKARWPTIRVLFMSGYTDDAVVRHGMLEPGLAYLEKPFRPAALLRKVREVVQSGRRAPE